MLPLVLRFTATFADDLARHDAVGALPCFQRKRPPQGVKAAQVTSQKELGDTRQGGEPGRMAIIFQVRQRRKSQNGRPEEAAQV
jgi:hypothetical protein